LELKQKRIQTQDSLDCWNCYPPLLLRHYHRPGGTTTAVMIVESRTGRHTSIFVTATEIVLPLWPLTWQNSLTTRQRQKTLGLAIQPGGQQKVAPLRP